MRKMEQNIVTVALHPLQDADQSLLNDHALQLAAAEPLSMPIDTYKHGYTYH